MKKLILSFVVILLLVNNLTAQYWQKIGGLNPYINKIFSPVNEPNRIIVASTGFPTDILQKNIEFPYIGNGYQESLDSGKSFTNYLLNERTVYDIYPSKINPDKWFAAIRYLTRGGVIVSTDAGKTWREEITCEGSNQIYRIASTVKDGKEFLVAAAINTREGFVYSDNDFTTCNYSSLSVETRSIAYSKVHPNLLFISGDASSQGRVLRSYDNGRTWHRESHGLDGLRVLSILPSSANPAIVLCGADSLTIDGSSIGKGIYISLDTGNTWQLLAAPGYQVFEFAEHPRYPQFVAAAAGTGGVLVSSIYGHYFEAFNAGLPTGKSVRTVMIPNWDPSDAGFVVFAGVYDDGLYKSTYLKTDVKENSTQIYGISSIAPQPAFNNVSISFNLPQSQLCDISIINSTGFEVYSLRNVYFSEGVNTFNWNSNEVPSGVYFILIKTNNEIYRAKFIINR